MSNATWRYLLDKEARMSDDWQRNYGKAATPKPARTATSRASRPASRSAASPQLIPSRAQSSRLRTDLPMNSGTTSRLRCQLQQYCENKQARRLDGQSGRSSRSGGLIPRAYHSSIHLSACITAAAIVIVAIMWFSLSSSTGTRHCSGSALSPALLLPALPLPLCYCI